MRPYHAFAVLFFGFFAVNVASSQGTFQEEQKSNCPCPPCNGISGADISRCELPGPGNPNGEPPPPGNQLGGGNPVDLGDGGCGLPTSQGEPGPMGGGYGPPSVAMPNKGLPTTGGGGKGTSNYGKTGYSFSCGV